MQRIASARAAAGRVTARTHAGCLAALGRSTSLSGWSYRHVPGKGELLDLMLDHVGGLNEDPSGWDDVTG